ncbi:uL15 family ribosomal protein [Candidatus Woesearchaeota archaeon]|nr:uL15 family ribosomal protein [Candidatus Woesearchaeota archaeon]
MQHRRKKVTKMRGSRTHGYGSHKKHRGAGSRGGRGRSGSGKRGDAKIMKITKGKRYLGKHGFTSKSARLIKSVNIFYLQSKLASLVSEGKIKKEKESFIINLNDLGFNKLLSKGPVDHKFIITTKYASKGVIEQVKKAGGEVILPAVKEAKQEKE